VGQDLFCARRILSPGSCAPSLQPPGFTVVFGWIVPLLLLLEWSIIV